MPIPLTQEMDGKPVVKGVLPGGPRQTIALAEGNIP